MAPKYFVLVAILAMAFLLATAMVSANRPEMEPQEEKAKNVLKPDDRGYGGGYRGYGPGYWDYEPGYGGRRGYGPGYGGRWGYGRRHRGRRGRYWGGWGHGRRRYCCRYVYGRCHNWC